MVQPSPVEGWSNVKTKNFMEEELRKSLLIDVVALRVIIEEALPIIEQAMDGSRIEIYKALVILSGMESKIIGGE